jgi:hypothetical protein
MANSNRVFVSPGVYTSEKDLTFVAQSVGVTTLGLVGETLKGPAFEPVLISNYDEFRIYFGNSSAVKDGDGNPRYELPYVAKSYLQESNQLFVTRILGLTGYRAGETYSILADNGVTVAALRARGFYTGSTLTYAATNVTISGATIASDPLSDFTLTVTTPSGNKTFVCNLNRSSSKFITKVLGTETFDKSYVDYPVYVHEVYPNYLRSAFEQGDITGLDTVSVFDETNKFVKEWDTAVSPMVVSEVRGTSVDDLFQVVTISDGDSSNTEVKIMIANIDFDRLEFDVIVRDFNDTDENMVSLEKFSRCSMDPNLPGYVARKIGTSDGNYELKSKYIMLTMADNHPTDAFPAGFKGFPSYDNGSSVLGATLYKTKYFVAGETMYDDLNGDPVVSNGDKVKKVSLGLSTQAGFQHDRDLFKYKGKAATGRTEGFHLSVNATGITSTLTLSGDMFICTEYDLEGVDKGALGSINNRKFTFATAGGFDGWDVYRSVRTLDDRFIFGKSLYLSGNTDNGGVFDPLAGNSDYYSYLTGINTFSNPEAVDINVFATPGINFFDHESLVTQAIDMVENERADSLYVINSKNRQTVEEVIDDMDTIGLDSNYSATYWPWIQVRDIDNSTQLYIPPTAEVVRNIALTDNVSYPWFAVAGYSRGIVNSIKAYKKLTLDERDELYKNRINPIATFSDTGTIIWGNKTLQVRESALDRINVRRLLIRARKLISAVAVRLLFEQNDEQVRNEFLRLVNPILESIKKERGVYEFRVTVSNDPEDIDANTLRGKIYIKPTRSLEFIDVEFIITPSGASFENI